MIRETKTYIASCNVYNNIRSENNNGTVIRDITVINYPQKYFVRRDSNKYTVHDTYLYIMVINTFLMYAIGSAYIQSFFIRFKTKIPTLTIYLSFKFYNY